MSGRVALTRNQTRMLDESIVFSPSDLTAFLACPHLASLEVRVAHGELERPYRHSWHVDLIRRKGEEHEARFLAELVDGVVGIDTELAFDAAARATVEERVRSCIRARGRLFAT